jgi:hypothetical protein
LQIGPLVLRICRLVLLSKFCPDHHSITRVSSLLGLRHRCQPIKGLNHCRTIDLTPTHQKSSQTHFSFSHFTKTDQTQKVQEQLEDSTNLQTLTDSVTLPNNKFITKSFSFFCQIQHHETITFIKITSISQRN